MKANRKKAEALDLAGYWQRTLEERNPFYDQDFIDALHDFMELPMYDLEAPHEPKEAIKVRSFHRRLQCGIILRYSQHEEPQQECKVLGELFFSTYFNRLNRLQRLLIYLVP